MAAWIADSAGKRAYDVCNIAQYLEVGLRAVDGRNHAFPRSESLLAFLFVANTEDCSTEDERYWSPELWRGKMAADVRCYDPPPGKLFDVDHYLQRYLALQPQGRVLVGVVAHESPPSLISTPEGGVFTEEVCGHTVRPVHTRLPPFVRKLQQRGAPRVEALFLDTICEVEQGSTAADGALLRFADEILQRLPPAKP